MAEGEFVYKPDLNRTHPPIDETVKMPRQVRLAVERAEDLIAGRQPRPIGVPAASAPSGSASKPTDAQINAALAWLEANVDSSNPDSTVALEIFRQGERIIKARRRGAQKPRKASTLVTQGWRPSFRLLGNSRLSSGSTPQELRRSSGCARPPCKNWAFPTKTVFSQRIRSDRTFGSSDPC